MRTSAVHGRRAATRWVLALAGLSALAAPIARAQGKAPSGQATASDSYEQRIKDLEETVNQLKKDTRQVEVNQENQKPLAGWSDGFTLASQDGAFKLRIGGYTQLDGRFFASDKDNLNTDTFLFRRARPILEGTVFKYFDFKIMPDFAGANFALFDAYIDVNYFNPFARLRIGKFKTPVGLERLQSATAIMFLERGQPTNLVPTRDVGIDLYGEVVDGIIGYRAGIYDGAPDLANEIQDFNDAKDFDGRLWFQPFKTTGIAPLLGFGAGIGGTYGYSKGSPTNTDLTAGYRSFGQATIFRYAAGSPATAANTAFAKGSRWRVNPSIYYSWGPLGVLTEYVTSAQGVTFNNATRQNEIENDAWTFGVSYLLTGEAASYRGASPAQAFDPWSPKWGAWEVVFRASQLHIDNQAFAQGFASHNNSVNKDTEFASGLNWYLNKSIKFMLDVAYSDFDGGAAGGADRESEYELGGRVQLVL